MPRSPRSPAEPDGGDAIDPAAVVGLLAEPARVRVFAALVLGAGTLEEVVATTGLPAPVVLRAADRLAAGGLIERLAAGRGEGPAYRSREDRIAAAARAGARNRAARPPGDPTLTGDEGQILGNFVVDGRLSSIPAARAKRRVVLDHLAARFEPGRVYPERDVNFMLGRVYADYAALRRLLVDEGFLERREGFYWRAGGSYEVD